MILPRSQGATAWFLRPPPLMRKAFLPIRGTRGQVHHPAQELFPPPVVLHGAATVACSWVLTMTKFNAYYANRAFDGLLKRTARSRVHVVAIILTSLSVVGCAGCGLTAGALVAAPGSLNFGNVSVGTTATQTVTLKNLGSSSLIVATADVSGGPFAIGGLPLPLTLAAGKDFTFQAKFAPKASGQSSGNMALSSTGNTSQVNVPLSGTGTNSPSALAINPSSVSFSNVTDGTTSTQTIKLTNSGNASLTISQASVSGPGFSIGGLPTPVTLPPGQSTTFNVLFDPQSAGAVTGSISLASNAPGSPSTIPLSGTGVAQALQLTPNPSSLNFGNVNVGSSSSQSLALTNTGNSNVTVQSVSTSGPGFSPSGGGFPVTLSAGQSVSVNVVFTPQSGGSANGSVSVTSTASNSVAVPLSGVGVQAVSHSASLTWNPSTSTISGYNVYRGTQSGGPYNKLTGSLDASTAYTDSTVQSGATYFYVVTAVDSSGNESVNSNEAAAVIP